MAKRSAPSRTSDYVPPRTTSLKEFLSNGSDEEFREVIYMMIAGLDSLLACRHDFGKLVGLTGSQFAVLIGVAYRQGIDGVTIRELADHLRLAPPHVTTEVGRLIRKGLLHKKPHMSDRRSVLVSLSQSGEGAIARLSPIMCKVNDLLFADVGSKDLAAVGKTMRTLVLNSQIALAELRRHQIAESLPGRKSKPLKPQARKSFDQRV
jgi:DNA-binding MarR family transcriptional regulator